MKKFICLGLLLCIVIAMLSSCNNSLSEGNDETIKETQASTAYERLSTKEKEFFNVFINVVNDFYNPSSVRILQVDTDVAGTKVADWEYIAWVKIQASNKAGATIAEWYAFYYDNGVPSLTECDNVPTLNSTSSLNVGNLNKALIEHWEEQGIY